MCTANAQLHVGYLYSKSWNYSNKLRQSLADMDLNLLEWDNEKKFMSSLYKDIIHECEYIDQRVIDLFDTLGYRGEKIKTQTHLNMVDNLHCLISSKTLKILAFKERYLTYLEAQKIKQIEKDIQNLEHICVDFKKLIS